MMCDWMPIYDFSIQKLKWGKDKIHSQHDQIKEMAFDCHLGKFSGSFTFERKKEELQQNTELKWNFNREKARPAVNHLSFYNSFCYDRISCGSTEKQIHHEQRKEIEAARVRDKE